MTLLSLLAGCGAPLGGAAGVCALEYLPDELDGPARVIGTQVEGDDGLLHVQVRWPDASPREGDRWPVVVFVHGGWYGEGTPVEEGLTHLDVSDGLVAVHLDLPGTGLSGGVDDRRGPAGRAAVATALRYAAGLLPDRGGCHLADRALAADVDDLYVLGASNGGNLAFATLGDPSLDLPPLRGLVAWEVPAGAAFATVQYGRELNVYDPGTCALDDDHAIRCADPDEPLVRVDGGLCYDVDGDGACAEDTDALVEGVYDPVSAREMLSPELLLALAEAGVDTRGYATPEDARTWWRARDAAQSAAALVEAWPDLPVIMLASEEDHVQVGLSDHPHVYGLGESLQAAGVAWLRLNPGPEWLEMTDGANPPNAPMRLDAPVLTLLTEEDETPLEALLTAGVRELADRRAADSWADELR